MSKALSRTFNLMGILFLLVWSPFFILTILDMEFNIIGQAGLQEVNFSLRCTLLILGSAKPVLYMICLKRFRTAFRYTSIRRLLKEMVKRKQPDTESMKSWGKMIKETTRGSMERSSERSPSILTITSDVTLVAMKDLRQN